MENQINMEKIKEHQKLSWQGMFYSIQRIDLLIVSICGAGIYVCLETIKYQTDNGLCPSISIKFSGLFFLVGIIVNFISQVYGYKANEQDYLMCDHQIDYGQNPTEEQARTIEELDRKSDKYSYWTVKLNYTSMGAMFFGLISTMIYFLFIY